MAWYVACRVRGSLPRWMQVSLRRLRAQPDLRDSERFDRALDLFVRQSTIDHEVASLALFPYEVDPVLNMGDAPGDPHDELPHDGEVPEEILRWPPSVGVGGFGRLWDRGRSGADLVRGLGGRQGAAGGGAHP